MTRKLTEAGILLRYEAKVRVYDLTGFMGAINSDPLPEKSKARTIKGYRVKVEY